MRDVRCLGAVLVLLAGPLGGGCAEPAGSAGTQRDAVGGLPGASMPGGASAPTTPGAPTADGSTATPADTAPGNGPVDSMPGEGMSPMPGQPPGNDGAGSAGGAAPPTETPGAGDERPLCIEDPSQLVIIGDSYINWASHTLPADLVRESGQTWRMYAIGGSSMASGGVAGFIPDQFELAVADNPDIRAVLMDGGGNDILIPAATWLGGQDCKNNPGSPDIPVCQMIVASALDRAQELMQRMAEAGVKDTVYFFYPHVPEGTVLGGTAPNSILDYALPMARELCESAIVFTGGAMRCHFVDLVPVFGDDLTLFAPTDIHPNTAGSAKMATAIWGAMQDACVGQPSGTACCAE